VRQVRVLVVDDQDPFRQVLCQVVGAVGGMVVVGEARSGEEALRAADELVPQLVVMDVRMPGMGGIEAARRLTAQHPDAVVLLVSIDEFDENGIGGSGAAAFMRKQQLSPRVLREAWRTHGSGDEPATARDG
jgi:two-component system invasion response regulator UvrY